LGGQDVGGRRNGRIKCSEGGAMEEKGRGGKNRAAVRKEEERKRRWVRE